MDTLVLNADGLPLSMLPVSLIGWRDAIKLTYLGKARTIHDYNSWVVRSPTTELVVPSVIMMDYYTKRRQIRYSRANIYLRDNYICQLCGADPGLAQLSLDHILPKSKGGKATWTNITTVCKPCNSRKGNNELIVPKRLPHVPSYHELAANRQLIPLHIKDEAWLNYIKLPNLHQIQNF